MMLDKTKMTLISSYMTLMGSENSLIASDMTLKFSEATLIASNMTLLGSDDTLIMSDMTLLGSDEVLVCDIIAIAQSSDVDSWGSGNSVDSWGSSNVLDNWGSGNMVDSLSLDGVDNWGSMVLNSLVCVYWWGLSNDWLSYWYVLDDFLDGDFWYDLGDLWSDTGNGTSRSKNLGLLYKLFWWWSITIMMNWSSNLNWSWSNMNWSLNNNLIMDWSSYFNWSSDLDWSWCWSSGDDFGINSSYFDNWSWSSWKSWDRKVSWSWWFVDSAGVTSDYWCVGVVYGLSEWYLHGMV